MPRPKSNTPAGIGAPPYAPEQLAKASEAELMEQVAARAAQNPNAMPAELAPWPAEPTDEAPSGQALAELLGPGEIDAMAAVVDADQDVDSLVASLNPAEAAALRQLLSDYANKG